MGVGFAVIVYLQKVLHYSPLQVGLLLLPAIVGRCAGELAAGHLSDRWGARGLSQAGLMIFATSCVALGQLDRRWSALLVALLLVVGNAGIALSNSPILYAGLRSLRDERVSMGSGLLSLVRIIGGTFGVGVVGPLVAWGDGYPLYFDLMAVLLLCTVIPACLIQSRPRTAIR